jgi:hypothetical protein
LPADLSPSPWDVELGHGRLVHEAGLVEADAVLRTDVRILLSVFIFDGAIVLYLDQFTRGPSRLKLRLGKGE